MFFINKTLRIMKKNNDDPSPLEDSLAPESAVAVLEESPPIEVKPLSFLEEGLAKALNPEEKIRACLGHMSKALAASGPVRFKDFWEGKKHCLDFFKDLSASRLRSQLWNDYTELSNEAKRLKEIMDEQAAFAAEQIDLAITSLEEEFKNYETLVAQVPEIPLLGDSIALRGNQESYRVVQKELHLLSHVASRVNALRKELVKTEMRLGLKSKLFDRLSACGDLVFPKRKELIKKISDLFLADVEQFITSCLSLRQGQSLYDLRTEVKVLQALAKELTLNTQAFSETRLKLSACWDRLKEEEKLKKKEFDDRRTSSRQGVEEISKMVENLAQKIAENIDIQEVETLERAILDEMRAKPLTRDDIRVLRESIEQAKNPLFEKMEKEKQERKQQQEEMERSRRAAVLEIKKELTALQQSTEEANAVFTKLSSIKEQMAGLSLTPADKKSMEREIVAVQDAVAKRKQQKLLSAQDKAALDELYQLLNERKVRRQEIRAIVENYRKAIGGSGLDFEKAMLFQENLENERIALTAMNKTIEELEEKIAELEE